MKNHTPPHTLAPPLPQPVFAPLLRWLVFSVLAMFASAMQAGAAIATVDTPTSASITDITATLGGTLVNNNGSAVTERGVVFSSTQLTPAIGVGDAVKVISLTGAVNTNEAFTSAAVALTAGTTYNYRAYATNGDGTGYSAVGTFTTDSAPTVISPTSATITHIAATLGGNVSSDNGASITARGVVYKLNSLAGNPSVGDGDVVNVAAAGTTGVFTAASGLLVKGTTYKFRAYATNAVGTSYSALDTFTTDSEPTVTSPTDTAITTTGATLGGNVTLENGATVTERGVVYSVASDVANPTTATGESAIVAGTTGVFTTDIEDLANGTTYAYRAYATNAVGTTYTDVETFKTTVVAPLMTSSSGSSGSLATDAATAVSSATIGGTIFLYGEESITRGVVYSLTGEDSTPNIGDPDVTDVNEDVEGANGAFTFDIEDLEPYKTYSYKAYVINSAGTSYTSVKTFTTPAVAPLISAPASGGISSTAATITANVTNSGGRPVTLRGVVFSKTSVNANPLIDGAGVTMVQATGTTGALSRALSGLTAGTQYSYKAFATNAAGTNYTTVATFTTSAVAPLMASVPTHTSVTSTLATLGGKVNSTGGSAITERGVVYSVFASVPVPTTVTGTKATVATNTTGVFTKAITGLTPGTKYAYRAYATNAVGTTYSATVGTFTTLKGRPLISLPTSASVTASTVTLGGTVTSNGGDTMTARGVVYSLTSINANPKLGLTGVKKSVHGTANSVSLFTVAVTGLQGGQSYSYRAYATNSKGTTYTAVSTFTTEDGAPTVASTPTKSTIAIKSATLGGKVTYSNGATITERGIVYSVFSQNATPVLGDVGDDASKKVVSGKLGSFSAIVSGLTAETKYAFRSYATNSEGTTYSNVGTFTTLEAAASVLAGAPSGSALSGAAASESYYTVGADGLKYLTIVINKAGSESPTVEVSGDLTEWFSGNSHTTVVSDDAGVLKVRDNTPVTADSKRYIRVKP